MLPNQVSGNTPDYVPEGREHLYPGSGTGEHNLGYTPDPRAQPEKRPTPMQERYGWDYKPGDELKGPLRVRVDVGTMNPSPEIRESENLAEEIAQPELVTLAIFLQDAEPAEPAITEPPPLPQSVYLLIEPEDWEPVEPETTEPPPPPVTPVVMLPVTPPAKKRGRPPKPR